MLSGATFMHEPITVIYSTTLGAHTNPPFAFALPYEPYVEMHTFRNDTV